MKKADNHQIFLFDMSTFSLQFHQFYWYTFQFNLTMTRNNFFQPVNKPIELVCLLLI